VQHTRPRGSDNERKKAVTEMETKCQRFNN
jgi:hypothetical protein